MFVLDFRQGAVGPPGRKGLQGLMGSPGAKGEDGEKGEREKSQDTVSWKMTSTENWLKQNAKPVIIGRQVQWETFAPLVQLSLALLDLQGNQESQVKWV